MNREALEVFCWCERITRWVPAEMVRAGQTVSCGYPSLAALHD